jgi:cytochrome b561
MASVPRLSGYRLPSILLHWLAAILIVALFVIGQMWEDAPRDTRVMLRGLHFSIGLIAILIVGSRLVWRFAAADGAPDTAANGLFDRLATVVKHLLYLVMLVLIVTGPLALWTEGRALPFFGLFTLPSPLPEMKSVSLALETTHIITTKALVPLVALHVLGAFKHLIIDRDGVFLRMLLPRR